MALNLSPILLASDQIKADDRVAQGFKNLLLDEMQGGVAELSDVAVKWKRGEFKDTRAMIVVETTGDALKLAQLGAPVKDVMLGGLHFREGSEELLPYVYLSNWDRMALNELRERGVRIICQDLPSTPPFVYQG
jgi:mannose/fructose/N-acetylgalactosamine-specific phosphotransferase system component IIB